MPFGRGPRQGAVRARHNIAGTRFDCVHVGSAVDKVCTGCWKEKPICTRFFSTIWNSSVAKIKRNDHPIGTRERRYERSGCRSGGTSVPAARSGEQGRGWGTASRPSFIRGSNGGGLHGRPRSPPADASAGVIRVRWWRPFARIPSPTDPAAGSFGRMAAPPRGSRSGMAASRSSPCHAPVSRDRRPDRRLHSFTGVRRPPEAPGQGPAPSGSRSFRCLPSSAGGAAFRPAA
jgi:hypothetical protein